MVKRGWHGGVRRWWLGWCSASKTPGASDRTDNVIPRALYEDPSINGQPNMAISKDSSSQIHGLSKSNQHEPPLSANSVQDSRFQDESQHEGDWYADESEDEHDDKKRKRPMSASCELCKLRKVKCDRGHPSCGWCQRNNQICEYKERKKPGLRAGYGRELEARLDRLEGILQNHETAIVQFTGQPITSFSSHQTQAETSSRDNGRGTGQTISNHERQQSSSHNLSPGGGQTSPVSYLPSSQHAPVLSNAGTQGYTGPSPSQQISSTLDSVQALSSSGFTPSDPPVESPSLNLYPPPPIKSATSDNELPPYDLLYALVDLYFRHINTWCPMLHRRATLDMLFGGSPIEEADKVLLHAIVATTMRFSQDQRLDTASRERYYQASKQKVLLYGVENSSVKALQALVILVLDIIGASNGPPAWNLLALITRSVVQLGLSVEATSPIIAPQNLSIYTLRAIVLPEPKDWIEDESRRRLFWMVYILDRYATIATAFEFALDEKEIDRKLPCRDDLFSRNQNVETRWFKRDDSGRSLQGLTSSLGAFSYYVEVVGILSKIHQFLKRPIDIAAPADVDHWQREYRTLDKLLNNWRGALPPEFRNAPHILHGHASSKQVDVGWIMLQVTFYTTTIRLHSSAAYPTTRSPIFTPSYSASKRCLAAVDFIIQLCKHARQNGLLDKLGPPFAFSIWVASRLLLVHGSTVEHYVNPDINIFLETLHEMGVYWKVAEKYANLLQRVLDEYHESQNAPANANGERDAPSTVKILADMRRCAFDLDFLISRQPRAQPVGQAALYPQPLRVPEQNELEYLDVFDFFNLPRLPVAGDGQAPQVPIEPVDGVEASMAMLPPADPSMMPNQFNITNFTMDAEADWFMKSPT